MKVVLADIEEGALTRAEGELRAEGATVASKRTDVSRGEDVEALARFTIDTFGAGHVVRNNAGVAGGDVLRQQARGGRPLRVALPRAYADRLQGQGLGALPGRREHAHRRVGAE